MAPETPADQLTPKQLAWKLYAATHREEICAKRRARYLRNREKELAYGREHRERINGNARVWALRNPDKLLAYRHARQRRNKGEVIAAYGGKCFCCGDTHFEFLSLDHVDGNGRKDRRGKEGSGFYAWLRRNGFPKEGYRLACINCNFAIGLYGTCPHESERLQNALREQLNEEVA